MTDGQSCKIWGACVGFGECITSWILMWFLFISPKQMTNKWAAVVWMQPFKSQTCLNLPSSIRAPLKWISQLLGQTKTENIPAMQRSTLPRTQRACWDQATKPSPAAAGLQPVGPDLKSMASAYMCPGMHAMWKSLDKGIFIRTHTCSAACSHCCLSPSTSV